MNVPFLYYDMCMFSAWIACKLWNNGKVSKTMPVFYIR